jgi:hypothetical protein
MMDIIGIENPRKIHGEPMTEFASLKEYLQLAKKMIGVFGGSMRAAMLKRDDVISNIATAIMNADWQWNGKGTKYGYRKYRALCAIKSYRQRVAKYYARGQVLSLDGVADRHSYTKHLRAKDERFNISEVHEIINSPILDERERQCLHSYYIEDKTFQQIAQEITPKVTKQRVEQIVKTSVKNLREYYESK